ncbi:hypothetical protein HDU80_003008 [Chytriomyces hyalinus]|nr:hypothetical protein HDU80_003008 [Chytriomyces hyalinus]
MSLQPALAQLTEGVPCCMNKNGRKFYRFHMCVMLMRVFLALGSFLKLRPSLEATATGTAGKISISRAASLPEFHPSEEGRYADVIDRFDISLKGLRGNLRCSCLDCRPFETHNGEHRCPRIPTSLCLQMPFTFKQPQPNNKKHKVSKIKGAEKAHPFSRKAAQLRRAFAREERVAGLKTMKDADRTRAVDRMVWFKYAIPDELPSANLELVHDLIDQYINRNEDEIEELKATIRPNRQRPPKIALLEMLQGKDRHEYATGMRVPDMCDAANVARLRKWEGDYNGIGAIKMVSITEASRRKVEEKAKENEDAMEAADADEE